MTTYTSSPVSVVEKAICCCWLEVYRSTLTSTPIVVTLVPSGSTVGGFVNDGSFMETFKRMQEEKARAEAAGMTADTKSSSTKATSSKSGSHSIASNKRKQRAVTSSGSSKKQKGGSKDEASTSSSAWQSYLEEVRKYESQTCKEYQQGAIVK
eukprot:m.108721 g.108721  ORF g.108721 m.108721 type:complete len:153 (-) comp10669_c0_seq1:302-760(-)